MEKKRIKHTFIIILLCLFTFIMNTSYAYTVTIKNTIYGNEEEVNYDKIFKYEVMTTYQCVGCDYRSISYADLAWHQNPNNKDAHITRNLIWPSGKINLSNKNSTIIDQSDATHDAKYYGIKVLEPNIDSDGNHYQISYKIDDGSIQHLSTTNEENRIIILDNLTKNTTIEFFYYLSEVPPTGISTSSLFLITPFSLLSLAIFVFYKFKKI